MYSIKLENFAMETVDRYLRGLMLASILLLAIVRSAGGLNVLLLVILFAVYAGTVELILLVHNRSSGSFAIVTALAELLFISWAYYTFRMSVLLLLYVLVLLRSRQEINVRRFPVVEVLGSLLYLSAIVVWSVEQSGTEVIRFLVLHVVILPALTIAAFLLVWKITQLIHKEISEERDELSRRLDARNDALATMSHEFRTPLTMMHSSSQILLEERPGPLNETQRRFVNTISESTSRLIRLAEDLLARIKVESAWLTLDLQEVDVRPLVKKAVQIMIPFAEQRERNLRYLYPHVLSPVKADPRWIHQVLVNLIHNAIKYTDGVGTIVLSVRENEEWVVVSVSDEGGGILNVRKTDVFRKFYQEHEESDGSIEGAGLGLAIVKNVVEKHHGKVYVGSVPGMGSIFSFTLPICRKVSS